MSVGLWSRLKHIDVSNLFSRLNNPFCTFWNSVPCRDLTLNPSQPALFLQTISFASTSKVEDATFWNHGVFCRIFILSRVILTIKHRFLFFCTPPHFISKQCHWKESSPINHVPMEFDLYYFIVWKNSFNFLDKYMHNSL